MTWLPRKDFLNPIMTATAGLPSAKLQKAIKMEQVSGVCCLDSCPTVACCRVPGLRPIPSASSLQPVAWSVPWTALMLGDQRASTGEGGANMCPALSPLASPSLNVALGNSMVNGDSFLDQETGHMHDHIWMPTHTYTCALIHLCIHSCTDGHMCMLTCLHMHHTYLYTQAFVHLFCLQGP